MHYTGQVYRPPVERRTPLLEVTAGCSHNSCTFCDMYRKTPFRVSPDEDIADDLKELSEYKESIDRIFLVNGDPFCLSAQRLLHIAEMIHSYLPHVETISTYCSVRDIKNKTFEELKSLKKAGFNDLYIGLESGYDPALEMMNKGYTAAEAREMLTRIKEAGFNYNALLMGGVAGRGKSRENVEATAQLLNDIKPGMVLFLSTSVSPGAPLAELRDRREYVELTEREHLEEELMLLRALDMPADCYFFGSHPYDLIPVSGYFADKEKIINHIEKTMAALSGAELDTVWQRGQL